MDIQEFVKQINDEIDEKSRAFEIFKNRKMEELQRAQQEFDFEISGLQNKRDMQVLQEKLKEFPAKLVKEHKTCSVCGMEMRPQKYVEGDQIKKAWMCQSSQQNHDFIIVT